MKKATPLKSLSADQLKWYCDAKKLGIEDLSRYLWPGPRPQCVEIGI